MKITPALVYHKPDPSDNIPEELHIWQDQNCSLGALVSAGQDVASGMTVKIALCERHARQEPEAREIIYIALGKDQTPRICGENHDPDGAGSYALIASWYAYAATPAAISAALATLCATNSECFFRLA